MRQAAVEEGRPPHQRARPLLTMHVEGAAQAMTAAPPNIAQVIKGANGQPVQLVQIGGRWIEVDAEIASIVRALNEAGCETIASCSGHGFRPGNIALADGREIIIARDFAEARKIDALFPLDINGGLRIVP